jgi:hypothetical protein
MLNHDTNNGAAARWYAEHGLAALPLVADGKRPATRRGMYDSATDLAGRRRRRDTSSRLPPLACGCRDPLLCRCGSSQRGHGDPPPSERMVDAAALAAAHLSAAGLPPIFDQATLRALWRRYGPDQHLYELAGG